MSKYRIQVKIELIECNDNFNENDLFEQADGSLAMTISEKDAISIDKCESSILQTAYPAIRKALSKHLSDVSKKKALERANSEADIIANEYPYQVDGEVGRLTFTTHRECNIHSQYNTATDLFSELKGKEFFRTVGFKEIAMIYGDTEQSYRKTADFINRFRYQESEGTPYRTLQDNTEKEGTAIIDYIEEKTKRILKENGFSEDGTYSGNNPIHTIDQPVTLCEEKIVKAAQECFCGDMINEVLNNPVCYEDPDQTIGISIDDVIVKRQEEIRHKSGASDEASKLKYVHNSVVHISKGEKSYTLNGYGIKT
jgi:hypothetical protein